MRVTSAAVDCCHSLLHSIRKLLSHHYATIYTVHAIFVGQEVYLAVFSMWCRLLALHYPARRTTRQSEEVGSSEGVKVIELAKVRVLFMCFVCWLCALLIGSLIACCRHSWCAGICIQQTHKHVTQQIAEKQYLQALHHSWGSHSSRQRCNIGFSLSHVCSHHIELHRSCSIAAAGAVATSSPTGSCIGVGDALRNDLEG